jgi:hypothetical protein
MIDDAFFLIYIYRNRYLHDLRSDYTWLYDVNDLVFLI